MKPNASQAKHSLRGQGTPAGNSYTLYVELLPYYSVPLIDAQRRVHRASSPIVASAEAKYLKLRLKVLLQ